MRRNLMSSIAGAAVAACVVLAGFSESEAGWGHRGWLGGGSYGSYGSGGSYGSWGSGGSGGSYSGYPYYGGQYYFHHQHHYTYRPHYWHWNAVGGYSGGSWGWGAGSSGGSSGGYYSGGSSGGSSGGNYSSGGSSGGVIYSEVPAGGTYYQDGAPAKQDTPPVPVDPAQDDIGAPKDARLGSNAQLIVSVPTNAKVFVNGRETTSTGDLRRFVSHDLSQGYSYKYDVRVEVTRDGKTEQQNRSVSMRAGQSANLAFNFDNAASVAQSPSSETTLTLHVPANAKVFLAGRETTTKGETRVFKTSKLPNGQAWSNYDVKVTVDQNGKTLTKQQTITLAAGDSRELTIDFNDEKVAQGGTPAAR